MELVTPLTKHLVKDWEIVTASGMVLPITLDESSGDSYTETDKAIIIKLAPRHSISNSSQQLPAEELIIYLAHVVSIQKRDREVEDLTPDQKDDAKKFWSDLKTSGTIQ